MNEDLKILIVDDNKENLKVVSNFLKELHYKIALATDGKSAIEILKVHAIDLILLDVMMPDIEGYEVCRIIKKEDKWKEIPIIFLTAKVETDNIVEGFQAGGVDYILKPFKKEELFARVKTHLELSMSKKKIMQQAQEINNINRKILSSIDFAVNIQNEMLPSIQNFKLHHPDSFLVYKPKDHLSGDFYWFTEFQQQTCIVLADCTGHGIPGALISIMAITLLNRMPHNTFLSNPAAVLQYMRLNSLKMLKQDPDSPRLLDSFEMACIVLEPQKGVVYYAGAGIGVTKISDMLEVETIKHDNYIFNDTNKEKPFKNITFCCNPGDNYYLYTDGLTDMFQPNFKNKYTENRFINFLKEINHTSANEKKVFIHSEINNWHGSGSQIDDITVFGIKV